ncbi:MAG TPA: hypothetical protein VHB77_19245 [Planctomycetaceae bacterium]|nr:hypothetical protein [Planctomycetaceae bacterium]
MHPRTYRYDDSHDAYCAWRFWIPDYLWRERIELKPGEECYLDWM